MIPRIGPRYSENMRGMHLHDFIGRRLGKYLC